MTAPLPAQPVAGILADELALLREFVALLKQEQAFLVKGRADALPALGEQKSALAARLVACTGRREAALGHAGLAVGRPGMAAWLEQSAADMAARQGWQEILTLAAEARSLNELNGTLIATHLQHTQQALGVLMAASDRVMTYGPDGQSRADGSGRSFGSA